MDSRRAELDKMVSARRWMTTYTVTTAVSQVSDGKTMEIAAAPGAKQG